MSYELVELSWKTGYSLCRSVQDFPYVNTPHLYRLYLLNRFNETPLTHHSIDLKLPLVYRIYRQHRPWKDQLLPRNCQRSLRPDAKVKLITLQSYASKEVSYSNFEIKNEFFKTFYGSLTWNQPQPFATIHLLYLSDIKRREREKKLLTAKIHLSKIIWANFSNYDSSSSSSSSSKLQIS